jgi:hypothetical protein
MSRFLGNMTEVTAVGEDRENLCGWLVCMMVAASPCCRGKYDKIGWQKAFEGTKGAEVDSHFLLYGIE